VVLDRWLSVLRSPPVLLMVKVNPGPDTNLSIPTLLKILKFLKRCRKARSHAPLKRICKTFADNVMYEDVLVVNYMNKISIPYSLSRT
jgi:hypothetical protein